jgi:2-polyprenyl-3-methyl-5-hydroxy-6-metoxy-1,4-benzoquinol methylase
LAYSTEQLREYLEWDVATWQQALLFWDQVLAAEPRDATKLRVLEVGARNGGLSLWLAQKGYSVVCSDLYEPDDQAKNLHAKHQISTHIQYRALDATALDEPDASYDIVLFKSVLGGIGMNNNRTAISQAMSELYRVLKPGGLLLFAENQQGSRLHQLGRQRFKSWGNQWCYLTLAELTNLLQPYREHSLKSYGYLACAANDFAPFVALDRLICKTTLSPNHYMAYGHARK